MNTFWLIAAGLALATVGALLPPVLRSRERNEPVAGNRGLHARRLAELQRDLEDRVIDADAFATAEDEITRALLEESRNEAPPQHVVARWLTIACIVLSIPAIAFFTYARLGQPALVEGANAVAEPGAVDQQTIDRMLAELEEKLRANPEDAEGWLLLGRSYMAMTRYAEAVAAFERAYAVTGDIPQVMLQYADALAMTENGRIGAKARALVERSLEIEPDNIAALWLAGLGAVEAAEPDLALTRLRRARELSAARGAPTAELDSIIAAIDAPGSAPSPAPGATAVLSVAVDVDPALIALVGETASVFVFARAPGGGGPPLAVSRAAAAELPRKFRLDDTMAMAPQFKLNEGDTVVVTARISASGQAIAQPGDLEGTSVPVTVGAAETVPVVIDRVLE